MKRAFKFRGGIGLYDQNGQSFFERDVITLVNNQIYLPTKNELNDPTEGFYDDKEILSFFNKYINNASEAKKRYEEFLNKIAQMGVYSLSSNVNNHLLWSYYGGGHSGFAIEYDVDELKKSLNYNMYFQFIYDFDVEYNENFPKIDFSIFKVKDITKVLRTFLGNKTINWKHEAEYRLIVDSKGLFEVDYKAVVGIYFGCKMQDKEIDYIMEKLKGRGLSYYKMEWVNKEYGFKPIMISDKYLDAPKYIANCIEYDINDFLITKDFLGNEAYKYKDKLIKALEIVKYEPLINKIYIATINMDSGEPLFIIWAYTKSGIPPCKEFNFKLNDFGEVYRIK